MVGEGVASTRLSLWVVLAVLFQAAEPFAEL